MEFTFADLLERCMIAVDEQYDMTSQAITEWETDMYIGDFTKEELYSEVLVHQQRFQEDCSRLVNLLEICSYLELESNVDGFDSLDDVWNWLKEKQNSIEFK